MENTENKEEKINKKPKTLIIILISIFVLLLVLGGFGWWYLGEKAKEEKAADKKSEEKKTTPTLSPSPKLSPATTPETSACPSTLTGADELEIATWETYTNSVYNYSFKYPESWSVNTTEDNYITMSGGEADINLQVRSAEMSAIGFPEYTLDSSEDITIACVDAHKSSFSQDTLRLIVVTFTKDDVNHLFMISYEYSGASISGDIIEAFDLILKTIKFE